MSEEIKRSLDDSDTQKINENLTILENELSSFMARSCRSESYDMDSKSVMAAEIMVNDNISEALYNLDETGVMIQFSFNEMIYDDLVKTDDIDQKNMSGTTYSIYTFKGKVGTSIRSWDNQTVYIRNAENDAGEVAITEVSTEDSTGVTMEMENPELAADFYTGVYQNLETKDGVSVTGDENNKTIVLSNGTEINVEYDSVSDTQLGWKKKFKKAKKYVKEHTTKVVGAAMITTGVVILAVYYAPAIISPSTLPFLISNAGWVNPVAGSLIASGIITINSDEYSYQYLTSTE